MAGCCQLVVQSEIIDSENKIKSSCAYSAGCNNNLVFLLAEHLAVKGSACRNSSLDGESQTASRPVSA